MDTIFGPSDEIEENEEILIHMFFHILDHDFRNGFYSNRSSIRDMSGCGFTDNDYINLSKEYYQLVPENSTYAQGQKFYQQLLNKYFDNMVIEKFQNVYSVAINEETHLLTDLVAILKTAYPVRNWREENIFILKTLDQRLEKEEEEIRLSAGNEKMQDSAGNVVKFPIKKKLTPEEIREGINEFLMVKSLGLTWEEARELAQKNFDKKMQGRVFEPYVPETDNRKPKI